MRTILITLAVFAVLAVLGFVGVTLFNASHMM